MQFVVNHERARGLRTGPILLAPSAGRAGLRFSGGSVTAAAAAAAATEEIRVHE